MKVESTNKNTLAKPPSSTADSVSGNTAVKSDFLEEAGNDEFMLFRESNGKTWGFARAHLVSARMKAPTLCDLNFRTHLVRFGGADCTRIYRPLLDSEVVAVVATDWVSPPPTIRVVGWLSVKVNEQEMEKDRS